MLVKDFLLLTHDVLIRLGDDSDQEVCKENAAQHYVDEPNNPNDAKKCVTDLRSILWQINISN